MHLPAHLSAPLPGPLRSSPNLQPRHWNVHLILFHIKLTHSLTTWHPDNEINTHHHNRRHQPPWLSASTSSPSSRDAVPTPRPWLAGRQSHFHLRQREASRPLGRGHYENGRCCGVVAARGPGRWYFRGGSRWGLARARRWRRRVLLGGRRGQGRGRRTGGWVSFFALDDQPQPNKTNFRLPRASPHLPPGRSA